MRVEGASCDPGPSPHARALRLNGLSADDGVALERLLGELPDPPWDVEVAVDDELVAPLTRAGFEPYATMVTMARSVEGFPPSLGAVGARPEAYRNEWAEEFTAFETEAMDGLSTFREMGQPTGYAEAEGFDCCLAARTESGRIVGFAQAMVPEGWINWMGVAPDWRRKGVGHRLLADVAEAIREARGTHLVALVEEGSSGQPFLAALGFRPGPRRLLMIRRSP